MCSIVDNKTFYQTMVQCSYVDILVACLIASHILMYDIQTFSFDGKNDFKVGD